MPRLTFPTTPKRSFAITVAPDKEIVMRQISFAFLLILFLPSLHAQEAPPYERLSRTPVNVRWDGVDLGDAMTELSAVVGVPVIVTADLKDRGDLVDLAWTGGRALSLLRVIARQHDVKFLLEDGVLIATTEQEAIQRTAMVKIYDIRGQIFPLTDFRGPRIGLARPEFEEEEPREVTQEGFTEDDLIDVLQSATGRNSWDHEGVSISAMHGRIIVRHSPSMHRRIERILASLGRL